MAKTTWSEVQKGQRVELAGRTLEVTKAKAKGKKVHVEVRDRFGTFDATVKAKDTVKLAKATSTPAPKGKAMKAGKQPLHDRAGAQSRWATDKESAAVDRREGLPAGNPAQHTPPHKPTAGPWDKPKGKTERMLEDILGARLVGEAEDENSGYYVPPVDIQTVAGHLLLFHGVPGMDYASMSDALELHERLHKDAVSPGGNPPKTVHWHVERRP